MNRDPAKPILDSLLEEVLCDLTPPDVTDRVLHALDVHDLEPGTRKHTERNLAAQKLGAQDEASSQAPALSPTRSAAEPQADHEPPTLTPAVTRATRSVSSSPVDSPGTVSLADERSHASWKAPVFWMACGAASITLIAALSMLVLQLNSADRRIADDQINPGENNRRVVERDAFPPSDLANQDDSSKPNTTPDEDTPNRVPSDNATQIATQDTPGDEVASPNRLRDDSPFREAPPFGQDRVASNGLPGDSDPNAMAPLPDSEIVQFVNLVIDREIDRQQVMPAPRISDRAWKERVCDVLLGRAPTEQEDLLFEQAPREGRREWFVEQLLTQSVYQREFSQRWGQLLAKQWSKSSASSMEPLLSRFVSHAISERQGIDEVVTSLLTATGSTNPQDPAYNPATALLAAHVGDAKHERLTGDVARQFLGRRLDCAQCHDHALASEWKQSDFWEMNAFFQQLKFKKTPEGHVAVSDEDFAGESKNFDDAVVFFEDESGELRAAHPRFDGQRFGSSGRVADLNRRAALAESLVQSSDFRRVIVNRIWAECFHVGFSRPSDELGTHNPVSHPELLRGLAEQFAAHDYRLRPLLKWMVLSDPFQRAQADSWDFAMDSPHLGHRPLFSRYYREWDRPESATDALSLITKQRDALARYEPGMNGVFANVPSVPGDNATTNSPESPELDKDLANAFVLRTHENPWGVSGYYARLLSSLANHESMPEDERLRHLFQLAVDRAPSASELAEARKLIDYQKQRDAAQGLQLGMQDVWWTLMMSQEFHH